MPTAGRRRWVPQAVGYFLRQDYPNRELVILDDDGAARDLIPNHPRIRYKQLRGTHTLGAKRNLCVAESRGDLILHWDDDDWFAPRRISDQVDALLRARAEICGLSRMLFHELSSRRTWLYEYPGEQRWLAGGSLLYTRDFWSRSPFPDVQIGEDTSFVWSRSLDGAVALDNPEIYVAMIHGCNTSPKLLDPGWTPWHGDVGRILGEDLDFYESMRSEPASVSIKAEIIVPTFGQEDFTLRCFDSLLAHTKGHRLVWVDNGSSAAARATVAKAFARHEHRLSIPACRNLGFVGGTNLGLQAILGDHASGAEYVVLLNNDTEVTAGWLDRLIGVLEHDPSIAAAGPMTSGSFAQCPANAGRVLDGTFGDLAVPVPMLPFFCVVLRKRVIERVGLLDPIFGMGLGDDDDYCFRLRTAGHGLGFVPGAYVVHHHRTTFRANYSDSEIAVMQEQNRAKFRTKHGLVCD
jgi:GT2 family glycosyltransferase